MNNTIVATYWVCQNCFLHLANGECGDCHREFHEGGTPLSKLRGEQIVPGMPSEEHDSECETHKLGRTPDGFECDCETNLFSTSVCQGCGSWYHGERYAVSSFGAIN